MFYADTGRYPTSIGELSSGGTAEAPLDKYIDDTTGFKCPLTKGAYFFNTDTNKIECTETDHNL